MIKIALNQEDFDKLVSVGVVEKDGAKIILQDIGYDVMQNILNEKIIDYENKNLSKKSTKDS